MESGEELRVNPVEVKKEYLKAVDNFKKELILRCGNYRIDIIEADINKGFDTVLQSYLVKRERLY
jgi:hypothetical protein